MLDIRVGHQHVVNSHLFLPRPCESNLVHYSNAIFIVDIVSHIIKTYVSLVAIIMSVCCQVIITEESAVTIFGHFYEGCETKGEMQAKGI